MSADASPDTPVDPRATAIQFVGSYNSCDAVTKFLGGPHATNHQWNTETVTGGHILSPHPMPFAPGDWIIRDGGRFVVAHEGPLRGEASGTPVQPWPKVHASPNCACGTNVAGVRFIDPICTEANRESP